MNRPQTPREALLMIRLRVAKRHIAPVTVSSDVDEIAGEGLRPSPGSYELTDLLADRLAEAHRLLRPIADNDDITMLIGRDTNIEILETLALPPDIEEMVERRIGTG